MNRDDLSNAYFHWLVDLVCRNRYSSHISYNKLLARLHNTEFRYILPMDKNRADDGRSFRYRFARDDAKRYLHGPCSVLEMMVALAVHCEEDIMDDGSFGDRTDQWFWGMISNLGLGSMTDDNFDRDFVDYAIDRFLNREYQSDGKGGLFTVRHCDRDLRTVEIWYQMCWYLDSIT